MRTIQTPQGPKHVGGRHRPVETRATHPHLFRAMNKYLALSQLPTAPSVVDYFSASKTALSNILGNDTLGDCTAAGACHIVDAVNGAAGNPLALTAAQAIAFYSQSTGYDPNDPSTDQGGDEITVLTSWRDKGIDGKGAHAILGWITVDASDEDELRTAQWLFENLYDGVELPDAWTNPFPSDGGTWDVAGEPDPNDGHCIVGVGANDDGVQKDTWGMIVTVTYAAMAKYFVESVGGNVFAVLTPEVIARASGKAPTGFDWGQLIADFDLLGGTVPNPSPAPAPGPAPVPTPGTITLAQAQGWAAGGLASGHSLMTRSHAQALASQGLASGWPKP